MSENPDHTREVRDLEYPPSVQLCRHCDAILVEGSRFCSACGMKHTEKAEVIAHHRTGNEPMLWPLLQYGTLLLFCAVVRFGKFDISATGAFVINGLMAAIVTAFALREMRSMRGVFSFRRVRVILIGAIIAGSMLAAYCVDQLGGAIERMSGEYWEMYMYEDTMYPVVLSLISIAVFPALFEEIAFRGVLFTQLNRVMSTTATIGVTAIAFSILHLSPISLIWIFPIGLVTGWLRMKTGVIWYGMILHFTYNATIVLLYFWSNEYFS